MAVKYQSAHRWPRAIKFNPHHLVLRSFLDLSQWVYVRDDMSKGLKFMPLGVINHGMSLSVLYLSFLFLNLCTNVSRSLSDSLSFPFMDILIRASKLLVCTDWKTSLGEWLLWDMLMSKKNDDRVYKKPWWKTHRWPDM